MDGGNGAGKQLPTHGGKSSLAEAVADAGKKRVNFVTMAHVKTPELFTGYYFAKNVFSNDAHKFDYLPSELQQTKVINANNEHQQISKKLEEIKAINDLQQKNLNDEIQKNKMHISTLETTATKLEHDYRKVLKLAEDRKRQNEQLTTKIIKLQDQLKIKEKLELEAQKLKEKLDSKCHMEDKFLKLVGDLHMDLRQRESSLKELVKSYTTLTNKESDSNEKLLKGQQKLIKRGNAIGTHYLFTLPTYDV